jgi:predicted transcriptional regulator of viral defense system
MEDIQIPEPILVLKSLAAEGRHILSTWRANLYLRRNIDPFYDENKVRRIIRKLERDGLIRPIDQNRGGLYQVTSPYARKTINVYEAIGEAYWMGVFCYATALELHRLTDQRSKKLHLINISPGDRSVIRSTKPDRTEEPAADTNVPLGSRPSEWRLHELPPTYHFSKFHGFEIKTHSIKREWLFGITETSFEGAPLRCTDLERTLIDGLRYPKYCGGLGEVFRGWVRALERINVDRLIAYTERFDQSILYQRVGFVMETLDLYHPSHTDWKREKTQRGGSRLLDPEREYSPTYSEEWSLSINYPISILENRDASYS